MVNKTNVLEIQLNGTQSCCRFLDIKGFGQVQSLRAKGTMNEAHKRQNTARITHPSVPKGTQNFTCLSPMVAHFQGILGFSMGQKALYWAQNGLKTLF